MDSNFIRKVREEYPDSFGMHRALNNNRHSVVGAYLRVEPKFGSLDMRPEEVLSALDEGRLHDIKKAAEKAIRRKALFDEWKKQE